MRRAHQSEACRHNLHPLRDPLWHPTHLICRTVIYQHSDTLLTWYIQQWYAQHSDTLLTVCVEQSYAPYPDALLTSCGEQSKIQYSDTLPNVSTQNSDTFWHPTHLIYRTIVYTTLWHPTHLMHMTIVRTALWHPNDAATNQGRDLSQRPRSLRDPFWCPTQLIYILNNHIYSPPTPYSPCA